MFIYTEKKKQQLLLDENYVCEGVDEVVEEATTLQETFLIRDRIYPTVEKVLSSPEGHRKFSNAVAAFVNRNASKLQAIGPVYLIPFTKNDEANFFEIFGIDEKEVVAIVKEVTSMINEKARWMLITQHPLYTVLFCAARYYTIKKDSKGLNNVLIITALAFYPSIFSKYFEYEPDKNVMHYTIDNLSERFTIKKVNTIFSTLTVTIQSAWKYHEKNIIHGADENCTRFIQRVQNDQNSIMRRIANAYYDNKKKGLSIVTQIDSYEDEAIADVENNSNKVESITSKIVIKMIMNGVDLKFCDFASSATSVSRIDLRNYMAKIINDKHSAEIKSFVESLLFLYLYEDKHELREINSKEFVNYALMTFKKTNSYDKNIQNIKGLLDKWGTEVGIYGKYNRLATRIDYTKAIYLYILLSIQKYV